MKRALILAAALGITSWGQAAPPLLDTPPRGPAYGEALFLLHAGDEHGALLRLLAARRSGALAREGSAARLALAWLWRKADLPVDDDEELAALMAKHLPAGTRSEAWLTLGDIRLRNGRFQAAVAALKRADKGLSAPARTRRLVLLTNALQALGRHEEAARLLEKASRPSGPWRAYARYNLAMAYLAGDRADAALPLLEEVGLMAGDGGELAALRDRANVTLASLALAGHRPADARAALNRVRLNGPFSARALLGLGWAEWQDGDPRAAQVVWSRLAGGDPADPVVQEARLGLPQTLWRLKSHTQAVKGFRETIGLFERQLARLQRHLKALEDPSRVQRLLDTLAGADEEDRPARLRRHPLGAYLGGLLLQPRFQATLTRAARLRQMSRRLARDRRHLAALPPSPGTDDLNRRLEKLAGDLARSREGLLEDFRTPIVNELREREHRLRQQLITARYQLARLLDEMATGGEEAP